MSKRILLIEDDASISQTLGRVLEMERHEVVLARNGHKAVSKFMHDQPDLVLLDLDLLEADGWQAVELIEDVRPFVPLVIITARPDEFEQASDHGVDALMQKPLNLPLLLQTVQSLMAEPEPERVARLTSRTFKTEFLLSEESGRDLDCAHGALRDWGIND